MKKIFILGLLLTPIMAHATGPSAVGQGQTAVVATASAPYATATEQTGDSTTVVSASYVKGAYNDAIAAVNKVNSDLSDLSSYVNNDVEDEISDLYDQIDDKQDKLVMVTGDEVSNEVIETREMDDYMRDNAAIFNASPNVSYFADKLVTANGVATGIMAALSRTGIRAVTTWGSNNTTVVSHVGN